MRSLVTCTLRQVYNQNHQVKRDRWAEHVALMGEKMNAYRILVRKPKAKRSLLRPRCRRLGKIKRVL
jgi:hypothetical protein